MPQTAINIESRASTPSSTPHCDCRKLRWDWFVISDSVSWRNLKALLSRWYAAFRSFRGHIHIQSSRMTEWVHLGPRYTLQDQFLLPNARTQARASGIEILHSRYDWVDSVDCRVFLMGFDAGEKYGMDSVGLLGNQARQQVLGEMVSCDQLSQVPDAGTDTSSHSRGHAQG